MSKHVSHGDIEAPEKPETETKNTESGPEVPGFGAASEETPEGNGPRAAEPGAGETQEPGPATPEDQLSSLQAQLAEAQDQFLRKAAEFENFRKRMNREKQDAIEFANQNLLLDLIPILDDFDRALKSAESSKDFTSLYEGINMIEKRFVSQLENKWGLKRFDSAGEGFDPNRHEAIMMDKSAEVTEPVVAEDFLKGYTLKDRVIRSAKVKVLMPEAPESAAQEGSA